MGTLVIAALCGLKDSINPCALTTLIFFLLFVSEFHRRRLPVFWYAALFISVVFVSLLTFSLGGLMAILYSELFFQTARRIYLLLGVALFVLGALHLYDWWMLRKTKDVRFGWLIAPLDGVSAEGGVKTSFIAVVVAAGIILSALSTLWPVDGYISVYSSFLLLPGKFVETYAMLFIYNFISVLPLIAVFIGVSSGFCSNMVRRNPTMVKIVTSAWLFSLGTGLIYIFR